jgi:DNA-binding beta-propeller fold protein YncE
VFGGQANPSGVAIDPAANKIYWGDTINAVRVGNLDGSGAPTNLFTEPDLGGGIEGQPLGVAIDPAANRIYWTDFAPYLIRVGNLDGSGSATTLFGAGSNPRGVAIDTAAGKIYWANSDREIRVGNLDGSGSPATLFGEFALGVAIDPAANKIYWGNGDDLRVGNLDGSGSAATLFAGVGAAWPAVLRSPSQTSGTPTAGEDPKCKKLRKKLKRQKKGLAKASTEAKRGMIQDNIEDTKKRLQKLGC